MVVMVPGNDDDLAVRPEALAERHQTRFRDPNRVTRRSLAELDDVTEKDQPVSLADRIAQRRQDAVVAQDVALGARTQMQV